MIKFTQKQIRQMVKEINAIDITQANHAGWIGEDYEEVGYSTGVYGINGLVLRGLRSGCLYVVTSRSRAIYLF